MPSAIAATMGRPTILFPFIGSQMGGSHISAFTLAEALKKEFAFRCVVVAAEGTLIARNAAERGLEVHLSGEAASAGHRHNPLTDLLRLPRRGRWLRALGRPGIIHCNDIGSLQSWGALGKLFGWGVVYHARSLHKPILANKVLISLADCVPCISETTRRLVSHLPPGRAPVIVNPFAMTTEVERERARAELLTELDLPSDSILIGFVGNFWNRKRPHFFLDVGREIAASEPRARFILFGREGEISQEELIRHSEKLGIAPVTRFAGFRLPVESNIAALDLGLYSAVEEPFGRTLVESIILGTPFVATDDAGHGEIVRRWRGGLLAPAAAGAADMAAMALSVLDAPDRVRLAEGERRAVSEQVSPKAHAAQIMEIYRQITGFA